MKKLLFLLLFCNFCFAQTKQLVTKPSGAQKTLDSKNCKDVAKYAQMDINDNNISLFLQGGIAPSIDPTDLIFEKKYSLKFDDLGCMANKCAERYNHIIFNYLSKTYGEKWTKEIQKEVLGFKKWKKST